MNQANEDGETLAEFLIDAINGDVSEHYLIEVSASG